MVKSDMIIEIARVQGLFTETIAKGMLAAMCEQVPGFGKSLQAAPIFADVDVVRNMWMIGCGTAVMKWGGSMQYSFELGRWVPSGARQSAMRPY